MLAGPIRKGKPPADFDLILGKPAIATPADQPPALVIRPLRTSIKRRGDRLTQGGDRHTFQAVAGTGRKFGRRTAAAGKELPNRARKGKF